MVGDTFFFFNNQKHNNVNPSGKAFGKIESKISCTLIVAPSASYTNGIFKVTIVQAIDPTMISPTMLQHSVKNGMIPFLFILSKKLVPKLNPMTGNKCLAKEEGIL